MNGLSRTNGQSNPLQPICAPMYGKYRLRPRLLSRPILTVAVESRYRQ